MRRGTVPALLLLAAGLTACGGGSSSTPKSTGTGTAAGPANAQTFTIHGTDRRQFVPATVNAKVGTLTLTLQNGGVPHNLVFQDSALPSIPAVSGSQTGSAKLTFSKPGTYTFVCTIHPGMSGKVIVQP